MAAVNGSNGARPDADAAWHRADIAGSGSGSLLGQKAGRGMCALAISIGIGMLAVGYLLPGVACLLLVVLLAIGASWVLLELNRFPRIPRHVARAILACLAAAVILPPTQKCLEQAPVALMADCRDAYLLKRLGCRRAASVADEVMRPGDMLVSEDSHPYWFRCPVTAAADVESSLAADFPAAGPGGDGSFPALLRQFGCTHLLLVDPSESSVPTSGSLLSRLVDEELKAHPDADLLPLVEYFVTEEDGSPRRFRLIMVRRLPSA